MRLPHIAYRKVAPGLEKGTLPNDQGFAESLLRVGGRMGVWTTRT